MDTTADPAELPRTVDHLDLARHELERSDLELLIDVLDDATIQATITRAGARMRAKHIRGGPAGFLADQLRSVRQRSLSLVAEPLLRPILEEACELLGEHADDPSVDDLRSIVEPLAASWSPNLAWFFMAWVAQTTMQAAPRAQTLLDADRPPPDTIQDDTPEPLPVEEGGDEQRALFTTLDEAVIRSVVAASNETIGAFSRADVRLLVDEVVRLNSARQTSWFHVGFLDALDDEWTPVVSEAGLNDERRTWLVFGMLSGHTRRQAWGRIQGLVADDWSSVEAVIADPHMGDSMTSPVVQSLLDDYPRRAADLLGIRQGAGAFQGWAETFVRAHDRARRLLNEQRVPEAKALWTVLGWFPQNVTARLGIDVTRRLVACARATDDFAAARRILSEIDLVDLPGSERAVLQTERGLVAAEIQHLRHISLGGEGAEHVLARLSRGRTDFESAVQIDPDEWRANLCLGVLDLQDKPTTAAARLQIALSGMQDDPVVAATDLPDETRFHAALAQLRQLEPGADGPAYADLVRACGNTWRPASALVVEAAELLRTYESRHVGAWLSFAEGMVRSPAPLAALVLELVLDGDPEVVDVARRMGRSRKVEQGIRVQLLTSLLEHISELDPATEDAILDDLDDLLHIADDEATDRQFATWLNGATARELLGTTEARLREVEIRRRLGEIEVAQDLVEELIHRTVTDEGGAYTPTDFLEIFEALAPTLDRLAKLQALVAPREPVRAEGDPVRVLFVGGNETQRAYRDRIERDISDRHGETVSVTWIYPGWNSNWKRYADQAESTYPESDVLVLMPLVRTNLGRRLRRTCGEHELPWVACTGHGRDAIRRSVDDAIRVVRGS